MDDIPQLMTTAEAAKALRCSTATVLRRLKNGDLEGSADMGRVTVRSIRELLGITPVGSLDELREVSKTLDDLESRESAEPEPSTPTKESDDAT